MSIAARVVRHWHRSLFAPVNSVTDPQSLVWLGLALAFAFGFGMLSIEQAFSADYVVQDDARQHLFWMQRFADPELFPGDRIADYFQSVAPHGFTALYRFAHVWGIDPLVFGKCVPMILSLLATAFIYGLCWEILPIPAAGFAASLLFNQNLWMKTTLRQAHHGHSPISFC